MAVKILARADQENITVPPSVVKGTEDGYSLSDCESAGFEYILQVPPHGHQ